VSDRRVHIDGQPFIPYQPERLSLPESEARGQAQYAELDRRRSVRFFSEDDVPRRLIETAIRTAGTAPSGAHQQPWTFVAIHDADTKRRIRLAAEAEERKSYEERMTEAWREALRPIGTDWQKPYLETVPWIVVVFAQTYGRNTDGTKQKHYYVKESVGISCGLFIAALHRMGLATLTHTPSPMGFLTRILGRPANEKPYILFPIGYPTDDCLVPDLRRKALEDIAVFHEPALHPLDD